MPISALFYSTLIGLTAGYIYGLAFVTQQKRVFLHSYQKNSTLLLITIMNPILRLIVLAIGFYYLIFCSFTHSLLMLGCFIAAFWYQLLRT